MPQETLDVSRALCAYVTSKARVQAGQQPGRTGSLVGALGQSGSDCVTVQWIVTSHAPFLF